jgi:hypothetical protein
MSSTTLIFIVNFLFYFSPFLLAAFFCLAFQLKFSSVSSLTQSYCFYLGILLMMAVFGGLRFHVGADWFNYEWYFDSVHINTNLFLSYSHFQTITQIEAGYFFLMYLIKFLGGSVVVLFLVSALLMSLSFYIFTIQFKKINHWFVLAFFIGFNFLYLYFATVRQSIALSFFLFGITFYLSGYKKGLLLILLAPFFQISSMAYIGLMGVAFFIKKNSAVFSKKRLLFFLAVCLFFIIFPPMGFIAMLMPGNLAQHFLEYKEYTGLNLAAYACGVFIMCAYLYINYRDHLVKQYEWLFSFTKLGLLLTFFSLLVFHQNSVIWVRVYMLISIFQSVAIALIVKEKPSDKWVVFIGLFLSIILFCGIFHAMLETGAQMIPYKSVLWK